MSVESWVFEEKKVWKTNMVLVTELENLKPDKMLNEGIHNCEPLYMLKHVCSTYGQLCNDICSQLFLFTAWTTY